jgi:hypothetical protein
MKSWNKKRGFQCLSYSFGMVASMETKPVQITLTPASDDPPEESDAYQAELRSFDEALWEKGLNPSSRVLLIEAVGHDVAPLLGVFSVALSSSFSVLGIALGAWLKGKYGRTVELEIDGTKAKASTIEEVQTLMEIAQKIRERNESERIVP